MLMIPCHTALSPKLKNPFLNGVEGISLRKIVDRVEGRKSFNRKRTSNSTKHNLEEGQSKGQPRGKGGIRGKWVQKGLIRFQEAEAEMIGTLQEERTVKSSVRLVSSFAILNTP